MSKDFDDQVHKRCNELSQERYAKNYEDLDSDTRIKLFEIACNDWCANYLKQVMDTFGTSEPKNNSKFGALK